MEVLRGSLVGTVGLLVEQAHLQDAENNTNSRNAHEAVQEASDLLDRFGQVIKYGERERIIQTDGISVSLDNPERQTAEVFVTEAIENSINVGYAIDAIIPSISPSTTFRLFLLRRGPIPRVEKLGQHASATDIATARSIMGGISERLAGAKSA